jgi:hypothetical protein
MLQTTFLKYGQISCGTQAPTWIPCAKMSSIQIIRYHMKIISKSYLSSLVEAKQWVPRCCSTIAVPAHCRFRMFDCLDQELSRSKVSWPALVPLKLLSWVIDRLKSVKLGPKVREGDSMRLKWNSMSSIGRTTNTLRKRARIPLSYLPLKLYNLQRKYPMKLIWVKSGLLLYWSLRERSLT